jgi:hypothetical protein
MNAILRIGTGLLVGAALSAAAAADETRIVGYGTDTTIVATNPNGPVWGGALVRQRGSGESAEIEVLEVQHSQPGRIARVTGSGESSQVIYVTPTGARRGA